MCLVNSQKLVRNPGLDNLAGMTDCFFEDFSISLASQALQAILGKRSEKSGLGVQSDV
jgi:hypothetical protein